MRDFLIITVQVVTAFVLLRTMWEMRRAARSQIASAITHIFSHREWAAAERRLRLQRQESPRVSPDVEAVREYLQPFHLLRRLVATKCMDEAFAADLLPADVEHIAGWLRDAGLGGEDARVLAFLNKLASRKPTHAA